MDSHSHRDRMEIESGRGREGGEDKHRVPEYCAGGWWLEQTGVGDEDDGRADDEMKTRHESGAAGVGGEMI